MAAAVIAAAALAAGLGGPASAHQQGLVNVQVGDVLSDNIITIPINAAANICGVSVNVLAADLADGPVTCDARANQEFTVLGFVGG